MNGNMGVVDVLPPIETSLADQMFAGTGEMPNLIRTRDWCNTPLGPVEAWPQSLRTAVSICLGSRHPIVLWWGPERWMFYNDGYRPMLGERHPHFLGRPGQECWSEIWNIIGPMMDQVVATGEATWSEDFFLLMRRSGYLEETYYTFSYSPIRDDMGRPCGIFNACTESTSRVLSERRMKLLRQMAFEARTVNEAAGLCAKILEQNPRDTPFALVYLLDDLSQHLRLAAQAGLPSGTAASQLVVQMQGSSKEGWPLARVAELGRSEVVEDLDRRFDCLPKEPWDEPAHQAMLLPITWPGGHQTAGVLVLGISPRRAFDNDYRGFFDMVASHVATAVSAARAFETERERAEKLAELDLVKTTFFSNVSHEFRTPLTLILGPIEDALEGPAKSLRGEGLQAVHRNTLRLLRLVNSLLDFSRVEAGRLQSRFEPTDLPLLTSGLAGSFQSLLDSAGLKLLVDCSPLVEPVFVDRSQWEKIVLNLISNAYKFTFEGGIEVRLYPAAGHIELSVKDTGTGIPAEELPKIFDRFHRVEGAQGRSFEGTGIGLALVQELARQHGGFVRVESIVGKGSTFVVAIPTGREHLPKDRVSSGGDLAAIETAAAPYLLEARHWATEVRTTAKSAPWNDSQADVTAKSSPIAPPQTGVLKARVLVVDDNADMREYLVRLLESRWTVDVVGDGEAALESAIRHSPDLILSDVMMPRLDGFGLLRKLRADQRTKAIPVILLSARAGEESAVGGLDAGADDYLAKPFAARELLARVNVHLDMARLRQDWARDLETANKELEAFSYSVSHDLRAPLRAIDGFSGLLMNQAAKLDDPGRNYLNRIRAATKHMATLIDDLLALARISRVSLRKESVSVTDVAHRIVDELRKRHPDRLVSVDIQDGLVCPGDGRFVTVALENLIANAWKYTGKRTEAVIRLGQRLVDGQLAFCLQDNGAGFDMAYAQKLFEPFQRLHDQSEFEGTGIGLATVHRIITRHGGRIWAEGAPDEGAAFFFTFGSER